MNWSVDMIFFGFAIAQAASLYVIVQIGRNVLDLVKRTRDPAEVERVRRFHALVEESAVLAKSSSDLLVKSEEIIKDVNALKEQIERMQEQSSRAPTLL